MKKQIVFIIGCVVTHSALGQENVFQAAEKTFRAALAKVILENPKNFTTEIIAQAQQHKTDKGYRELLKAAHKLKADPAILNHLNLNNQKLKNGSDVMENIIDPDPAKRKTLMSYLDLFEEDETQINKFINDRTNQKEFSNEELQTISDALAETTAA